MTVTDQRADLADVEVLPEELRRYVDPTAWAIDTADESWGLVCSAGHVTDTTTSAPDDLGSGHCRAEDEDEQTGRAYRCGRSLDELVVLDTDDQQTRPRQ